MDWFYCDQAERFDQSVEQSVEQDVLHNEKGQCDQSGSNYEGSCEGSFKGGATDRPIRYSKELCQALIQAQRVAPDNVSINWLLYLGWPPSATELWLFDGIGEVGRLMRRSQLQRYIVELDNGFMELVLPLAETLGPHDSLMMRVRLPLQIATLNNIRGGSVLNETEAKWHWAERRVTKRALLIRLLQHNPRCAKAFKMLAQTMDNPFERITWEREGETCGYNRGQLWEQAELLDPA